MNKLNLNEYGDREVLQAIMSLNATKFLRVMSALAAIGGKLESRGKLIAKQMGEEEMDELIRRLAGEE